MIKNVVFDIGRVLIEYDPIAYMDSLGYRGETARRLNELIFENPIWNELDRGTYTFEEARRITIENAPELADEINLVTDEKWLEILTEKKDTVQFLKSLKKEGYKIYFLSNFSQEGFAYIEQKYDFFKEGDGRIISSHVHLLKPDPEIYRVLLETYSLQPEETVFIDDLRVNIDAASKLDIKTILFTDLEEVISRFNILKD